MAAILSRPKIQPHHATARFAWARRYEHFSPEDWAEAWLPQLLRPGDIFMHDGASVHRAQIV
jgi:hypothetical protein